MTFEWVDEMKNRIAELALQANQADAYEEKIETEIVMLQADVIGLRLANEELDRQYAKADSKAMALAEDNARLRDVVVDLCLQFAVPAENPAGVMTGGLSALEEAFELLGWNDPHPTPEAACDEPGCGGFATCGFPVLNGYRRTCGEHYNP